MTVYNDLNVFHSQDYQLYLSLSIIKQLKGTGKRRGRDGERGREYKQGGMANLQISAL